MWGISVKPKSFSVLVIGDPGDSSAIYTSMKKVIKNIDEK